MGLGLGLKRAFSVHIEQFFANTFTSESNMNKLNWILFQYSTVKPFETSQFSTAKPPLLYGGGGGYHPSKAINFHPTPSSFQVGLNEEIVKHIALCSVNRYWLKKVCTQLAKRTVREVDPAPPAQWTARDQPLTLFLANWVVTSGTQHDCTRIDVRETSHLTRICKNFIYGEQSFVATLWCAHNTSQLLA